MNINISVKQEYSSYIYTEGYSKSKADVKRIYMHIGVKACRESICMYVYILK